MKFKVVVSLVLALVLILSASCGFEYDPMLDDMWTRSIFPGLPNTYVIGSENHTFLEGWFDNLYVGNTTTDNLTVSTNTTFEGPITLVGDGKVWIEFRPDLDFVTITAHGTPDWVTRGVFGGFSLPLQPVANEELPFAFCVPGRWSEPAWTYLQDVGSEPGQPGVYDGLLYIPSELTDEVYEYRDGVFSVSGAVGNRPLMVLGYDGDLYTTCYGDDEVWVYDGVVWSLSGAVGNGPTGMAILEDQLYVSCLLDDEIWTFDGTLWQVDPALGLGGVAGAVGDAPEWMVTFGADLYVGCGGVDDDVWIRNAGAWTKDDDVGNQPQVFHQADPGPTLYLACETDNEIWSRTGVGTWEVVTNIEGNTDGAPIGLEEYEGNLFTACADSVWADISGFWNCNSDYSKITADQPMFFEVYDGKLYCICKVGNSVWVYDGETAGIRIRCWLSAAQVTATDAFKLYIEYENFTGGVDIVPITGDDVIVEVTTGVVAQFQSYNVRFPLDMTGVDHDDSMGFILQSITSSDDIAGEIVIHDIGFILLCDKLGNPTID